MEVKMKIHNAIAIIALMHVIKNCVLNKKSMTKINAQRKYLSGKTKWDKIKQRVTKICRSGKNIEKYHKNK